MSGPLEIRVVDDEADVAAWVDAFNRVAPLPTTVAETAFFRVHDKGRVDHLALRDGRIVGNCMTLPIPYRPGSGMAELMVRVPPGERRQGVGGALYETARRHLLTTGKTSAETVVRANEADALVFAARRGFVEHSRNKVVALDLTAFEPSDDPPPPGIELTDLARRPDLLRAVYELDLAASPDIPGDDQPYEWTFEEYSDLMTKPGTEPSLIVVAITAGGEVVGSAMLNPVLAAPTNATHQLTAVRRDWRGRGVATAMKHAQLRAAKAAGVRRVRTFNEVRNEPMRRLNDRLGYTPEPDSILMRGPLEQAP